MTMKTKQLRRGAPVAAGAGLVVLALCAAFGQSAPPLPQFEVASVKPSPPPTGHGIMRRIGPPDPGMVNYGNATLTMLISRAYGVKDYQVSGPDWLDSQGYDVVAKVPAGVPADQVPLMLQALLSERFKLALHRESKTINVYALIVGKGGPKLKESDPAELAAVPGRGNAGFGAGPPAPPPPGAGPGRGLPPGPGVRMMVSPNGGRQLNGRMTLAQLTDTMSFFMDRPVVDSTGLKGTYDIDMTFMPDERDQMRNRLGPAMVGPPPGGVTDPRPAESAEDATAGSIFSAVQEKLGLKLDARKSPAEILVIDHAEKIPTEN
jgi:uncharacterized protein (TIGR03435 family)